MPVIDGRWDMGLFPRQYEIISSCRPSENNLPRLVLADGPRWASKTVGCINAVADHAWNTDRANIAVLTITQSVGLDSGVWTDLVDTVIPDWINGNFGMEWDRKPYTESVTKKPACKIINKYGTVSKIQLDSLKDEGEVENRYKGKRYSMIFVNELSKFKTRKTFDTLKQCLRMLHLPEGAHVLLADTNPADEGEESWIYKLWEVERSLRDEEPGEGEPDLRPLRRALVRIPFTIDDNLAMSPEKRASLYADFAHDEDLLARYFYGKWVTASIDAIFHKQFRPLWHVIGEESTASNPDPDMMLPEEGCIELLTGWDPGPRNCAMCIAEKVFPADPIYKGLPIIKILDELCIVDEDFDFQEFVTKSMVLMNTWEKIAGRKVRWQHWSDRSVFDTKDLESQKYYAQLIFEMSEGVIELTAAERSPGTLRAGIELMQRLFWENRLLINKKCVKTVHAVKSIKRGTNALQVVQKGSKHKHPLDAMRYMVQSELYEELHRLLRVRVGKMKEAESGKHELVGISL